MIIVFDEVYILFHFNIILNTTGCPLLKLKIKNFNPLNTQLNPICHLLALLGAHHILHFSGIRVK